MNKLIVATVFVSATSVAVTASAQRPPTSDEGPGYFSQRVAAPSNAFELSVGTGYTQSVGMLRSGVRMASVVTPGLTFDLGAGYRLNPHWALGATGQYQELSAERATGARGLTTGLAATYHIAPYVRTDPWIQLGTGYRMLWETYASPAPNELTHGFQLAKLTAGLDLRFSEDVAVAPVVGADLNVFVWQDVRSSTAIADPRLSTFFFAGAQGRFDLAGSRQNASDSSMASR